MAKEATVGERFDVVQAHFDKSLIAADAVRTQCGGCLVFDAVEIPFDMEKLPKARDMRALRVAEMSLERPIAESAMRCLTIGSALAERIGGMFGGNRPVVIRNCTASKLKPGFSSLRADLGLSDRHRLIATLNSFRPNDGLEVVVDALSLLPESDHLVVLGAASQGVSSKVLMRRASGNGTLHRLHFPPLQPASKLVDYISAADMGVVPLRPSTSNLRIALPNRVFELLAANLPVAVSRLRDVADLVTEFDAGQVYDEDSPQAAARAITEILGDLPRYRAAAANAARSLNWEREGSTYLKVIEELIATPRRANGG
jgi:glycosyltransferase involved in cell wall biosynthesis